MAPARRQAIIWSNDVWIRDAYMRHSASMSYYIYAFAMQWYCCVAAPFHVTYMTYLVLINLQYERTFTINYFLQCFNTNLFDIIPRNRLLSWYCVLVDIRTVKKHTSFYIYHTIQNTIWSNYTINTSCFCPPLYSVLRLTTAFHISLH